MVPASGDAHKNCHSPLAGIRSGIDNSACEDAIKILHSHERSFCNIFAEMHIEIYIPPLREYEPESTVPLVGVQSKVYIPASGDFVIISVYRPLLHPRKRRFCIYFGSWSPRAEMHIKIVIPPSREYDLESTIPLAGMQSKYCIPENGASVTFSRRCT